MSLLFMIPLAIALGAAYIYENCKDEVGTIAAVGGFACLILGLVLLPWPIQLLLLAFVLISTRQVSL